MTDDVLMRATKKTPKFSLDGTATFAKCVDVYDGDTAQFVFRIFPVGPLYRFSCRMMGYNSAEIKGQTEEERNKALEAKKALSDLILDKVVALKLGKFDKYGRVLVTVSVNNIDVNKYMVDNNYGKIYTGRGAKLW
jgi:endonuclease YncB( thermonuclease family)